MRREAKRHAALDTVPYLSGVLALPFGADPKRRRRYALPAHSKGARAYDRHVRIDLVFPACQ